MGQKISFFQVMSAENKAFAARKDKKSNPVIPTERNSLGTVLSEFFFYSISCFIIPHVRRCAGNG